MEDISEGRPDVLVLPPIATMVGFLATLILQLVYPFYWIPQFPSPLMMLFGAFMIGCGAALGAYSASRFYEAETTIHPRHAVSALVTEGPYRYTRNPMYVGLLLIHMGLGLGSSLDWTLITTVVLAIVLHVGVIIPEENYLSARFGDEYEAFRKRVRRWI